MLEVTTQNMNFNGNSNIVNTLVMEMSASSDGNNIWMNININDIEKYFANQISIDTDWEDFKTIVMNAIKKLKNTEGNV